MSRGNTLKKEAEKSAKSRLVIMGAGPGGYEAALSARQMNFDVTLVCEGAPGGNAVNADVMPAKTLISTSDWVSSSEFASELGVIGIEPQIDLQALNRRIKKLTEQQSSDIEERLCSHGVNVVRGHALLSSRKNSTCRYLVQVTNDQQGTFLVNEALRSAEPSSTYLSADYLLIATGSVPRELPGSVCDGQRILNWQQLPKLDDVPEELIIVGAGPTGVEFAGAYQSLGSKVTLVSSRSSIVPHHDSDASSFIERTFTLRGMKIHHDRRATRVRNLGNRVEVVLDDGKKIDGSHCLIAIGAKPNTENIGLGNLGVEVTESGHIVVDQVSQTSRKQIYAAGDCTGVLPLASIAAQQGRIAVAHAVGEPVVPLDIKGTAQAIFTSPQLSSVGMTEREAEELKIPTISIKLPLDRNPRAKMQGLKGGFVKLLALEENGKVVGGVVVSQRASDLIFGISLAISNGLTVDQVASSSVVYPSMSESLAEAARILHYKDSK